MFARRFAGVVMLGLFVAAGCGDDDVSGGPSRDSGVDSALDATGDGSLDGRRDGTQGDDGGESGDAGTCSGDEDCAALSGPCQLATCDEDSGTCRVEPLPDGTGCDDGDACTESDACQGGQCVGAPIDCDDGLDCTEDVCTEGSCDHIVQAGSCLIEGTCWDDGALNPNNECEHCDAAQAEAWSPVVVGEHCRAGDGPCTRGECDGTGNCVAVNLENFTDCDDGDTATLGDWCYAGECGGFEQQILPSDSCDEEDKFHAAASASAMGIHAVFVKGVDSFFGCTRRFCVESIESGNVFDEQDLGDAGQGATTAVAGDRLVVSDSLFEKVGSSWTSQVSQGTLRRAWNNVSGNWQTRWVRLLGVGTDVFLGVGFRTDGTPLARRCVYLCGPTCDWYCGNDRIEAQSDVALVGIALVSGQEAYLGGFRLGSSANLLPIVDFQRSGAQEWRELAQAGQGSDESIRDFIGVGDHVLGVGFDGVMVWGAPDNIAQVCDTTFAGYDLLQAVRFQGRVFVLYTKLLTGTQGDGRVFGVTHTASDADDCGAWVFHDIVTYLDVGPVGPGNFTGDPATWDYDYRVLAVSDHEMYLLGSWWDERTAHRAKSFLRWSLP